MEATNSSISPRSTVQAMNAEFIEAVRGQLEAAITDKANTQRLLRKQLETQIQQFNVKEENLLDLAADGELPVAKIKARLHEITRQRDKLTAELATVEDDLSGGLAYINAHLDLLADPYELYRYASEYTRQKLNQALFARVYVVNDEVVGDELTSPLSELLAAERGWSALEAGLPLETAVEAAEAEHTRRSPYIREQATPKGDLFSVVSLGDLLPALKNRDDCSKPPMVRVQGL